MNRDPLGFGGFVSGPASLQKKKQKDENFLAGLLPTGGGIAGSLGGAAGGAAIGSIVPGVGTAIGGLIGALLGGAGGSALGKVGENAVEGNQDLGEGVLGEALLGGVTSTPIGAGFKVLRAGGKVATGLGKKSAADLMQEAGIQTIGKRTASKYGLTNPATNRAGKLSTSFTDTGNRMLASQSQLTGAQARQMGIRPVTTLGSVNARTGLTKLDDMAEVGRGLTGAGEDSILDTLTRSAVGSTNGVKMPNLMEVTTKLLDDSGALISDATRKRLISNVTRASTSMRGGSKGSLSTLANPSSALDQANSFRGTARELTNSFTATPEQKQLAKVYNGLAKRIEDAIYSSPGVNDSIPTLVKAGADDLLFRAQELRAAGNATQAKAFEKIATELRGVKDVSGLRKMKKDFVDIGKIDNATAQVQGARSLSGADISSKAGNLIRNPMNLLATPLDAATPAIAGGATRLGRAMQGGATRSAGQGVIPLALRQGAGRLVAGAGADQPQDMSLEDALMASGSVDGGFGEQAESQVEQPTNPFGYSAQEIGQALMQALVAGDTKAASQLNQMYELASQFEKAQGSDLNATSQKALAQSANGTNTLDQLEQLLTQAGGGQGPIGGNLQSFLGTVGINNDARTYNDLSMGSVAQIAKALGETGALSDSDIRTYGAMIPKLSDPPEVAKAKFAALRQRLAVAQQNVATFGAGPDDLESVLAGL